MSARTSRAGRLLEGLVRARSPSGDEDEAARVLLNHFDERGVRAWRDDAGNVHAVRGPEDADPALLLLGHVDTVPGGPKPRWEDDVLYGRGTVDAKGPLTAHTLAFTRIEDPAVPVRLVAAVEEETTGAGARHLVDVLGEPDGVVIAEPTGSTRVGLGYKGRTRARLTARTETSHPGEPSPRAAELLLDGIDAWTHATDNPERDPGMEEPTLRVLELATTSDGDRERAHAEIDLRHPGQPPTQDAIASHLPSGVEVEVLDALPAVHADPRNPVATALRGGLHAQGLRPGQVQKTGTSDWNVLATRWDAPTAAYGPGNAGLDHTPDEHVELAEVQQAARVLEDSLGRLIPSVAARA